MKCGGSLARAVGWEGGERAWRGRASSAFLGEAIQRRLLGARNWSPLGRAVHSTSLWVWRRGRESQAQRQHSASWDRWWVFRPVCSPPTPPPPGVQWIMGSGVRLGCLLTPTPPSWDPVPASGDVWQGQRAACVVRQRHPAGDRDPSLLSRQPGPRSPSLSFWARWGAPQEASCPAVRRFFPSCVFQNCPVCLGITSPHACSLRASKRPA